jgi:4-hydroxy-tetrahydrodipicolinate synthase
MDTQQLRGASVAIVTPFRGGEVDEMALATLTESMITGGLSSIVACGTTGEAATLSAAERLRVVQVVKAQARNRVPVIAGVSTNDTRAAVAEAKAYAEVGADALLVVTPYYNKPNQEGLFQHFKAVADAVALPQVIYNVPGRTAKRIDVPTLARLCALPNVLATKDATGDLNFLTETIEACGPDRLALLSGDDFTFFPFLALGGHGGISVVANVAPALISALCRAATDRRWDDARALHHRVWRLAQWMFMDANPIPVKAALALQGLIAHELRLPLVPMDGAALEKLRAGLQAEGLL